MTIHLTNIIIAQLIFITFNANSEILMFYNGFWNNNNEKWQFITESYTSDGTCLPDS